MAVCPSYVTRRSVRIIRDSNINPDLLAEVGTERLQPFVLSFQVLAVFPGFIGFDPQLLVFLQRCGECSGQCSQTAGSILLYFMSVMSVRVKPSRLRKTVVPSNSLSVTRAP